MKTNKSFKAFCCIETRLWTSEFKGMNAVDNQAGEGRWAWFSAVIAQAIVANHKAGRSPNPVSWSRQYRKHTLEIGQGDAFVLRKPWHPSR